MGSLERPEVSLYVKLVSFSSGKEGTYFRAVYTASGGRETYLSVIGPFT